MAINKRVFINCPYDRDYVPLFRSMIFTVVACGYEPRAACERGDQSQTRMSFILQMVKECRLSIHDLSRARAKKARELSRFNLPFELGLYVAAKNLLPKSKTKDSRILILERNKHELIKALSDLNGLDPVPHRDAKKNVISAVREFLKPKVSVGIIPGPAEINREKRKFDGALPVICEELGLYEKDINFTDYVFCASEFCKKHL